MVAAGSAKKREYDIEPIGDRVVVRRDKAASMTAGGIVLPDGAVPNPKFGTIIAIGPGALRAFSKPSDDAIDLKDGDRFPMQCRVGDRVILPMGAEILRLDPDDEASEVVVCGENQILAIVR
jgi:chaperonin GroES